MSANDPKRTCNLSPLFFVFFFCFAERRLLFGQQFSDLLPLRRIGDGFEHFPIVLNILSMDKAFHNLASLVSFLFRPLALDQSGFAPIMLFYDIKWLNGNQSRQPRQISSWSLVFMTKANTTRWYSPVSVMVWAGAMCKRSVTFRLSQHIGGRGRRVTTKCCVSPL